MSSDDGSPRKFPTSFWKKTNIRVSLLGFDSHPILSVIFFMRDHLVRTEIFYYDLFKLRTPRDPIGTVIVLRLSRVDYWVNRVWWCDFRIVFFYVRLQVRIFDEGSHRWQDVLQMYTDVFQSKKFFLNVSWFSFFNIVWQFSV